MEAETEGGEGWDPRLDCGSVESRRGEGGRSLAVAEFCLVHISIYPHP